MLSKLKKGIKSPQKVPPYLISRLVDLANNQIRRYEFYTGDSVNGKKYTAADIHELIVFADYDSYISRRLYLDGDKLYQGIVDLIEDEITVGDTVIDIGAHIGYFSLTMANMVGNEGSVISVEPHPTNFELLCKNVCLNGYSERITKKNIAMSSEAGQVELYVHPSNHGEHSVNTKYSDESISVPCNVGDEVLPDDIDFVKIDVEGHEREIIEGMSSKISKSHPNILFEYDHKYWDYSDISHLQKILKDYDFYLVDSDYGINNRIDLADLRDIERTNVYCTSEKDHNNI